jgi:hypothetical protein
VHLSCAGGNPRPPGYDPCTPIRQSVLFSRRRGGGQRLREGIQPPDHFHGPQLHWTADVLQPAVADLFFKRPTKVCRECLAYGRPCRRSMLPIVDWPLCLGETPAPFTSWSPSIATLGPSCTPNGQSGIDQKDLPTKERFGRRHRSRM